MGFVPSKADFDLWLKDCGTHYEYICCWIDDVICCNRNYQALLDEFIPRPDYTLKGMGAPRYYLGGNYGRIKDKKYKNKEGETCYLSAKTYIENVCAKIELTFENKLRHFYMPMDPNYRLEIDDTDLLSPTMASKYRMLVENAL